MSTASRWSAFLLAAVFLCAGAVFGWLAWPTAPGSAIARAGTERYVVVVSTERPRLGSTDVDVDITPRERSTGVMVIRNVQVQAVMPLMGYATQPVTAAITSADNYHATGLPLMMTGPWQLVVAIKSAEGIDRLTLPVWVSG